MYDINKTNREISLFLFDVYIAILKIEKVASKFNNVNELLYDFTKWDSVIREFEIIGEASKYLIKDNILDKSYQVIVDFRNQITHEYFGIDQDIVWMIIQKDLKDIKNVIEQKIYQLDSNLKNELIESFIEDNYYLDFVIKRLKELS
jgi:uncharacterized protein with HEPN domain